MTERTGNSVKPEAYIPEEIEPRWQRAWSAAGAFATPEADPGRRDTYVFVSAPFTSGDAHLGHVRSYSIADAYVRFRRAQGDALLFSLGFDTFGIPSETAAAERGMEPEEWVDLCRKRMQSQFDRIGISFDWSRSFVSCAPTMYKWSQMLFLRLYEAGLVSRRKGSVDWCDQCQTPLAANQVEDGLCWRCETKARLVLRSEWYLRLSAYNEENWRRIEELDGWSKTAISTQRALLGRQAGVEFEAPSAEAGPLTVFTSSPDRIREAIGVAVSPYHPELERLIEGDLDAFLGDLRHACRSRSARTAAASPVLETGSTATIPGTGARVPIVVSPAVDAVHGPAAILALPGDEPYAGFLAGSREEPPAMKANGREPLLTRPAVRFRATDFAISRQRAWGTPIPLIACDSCGLVPVADDALPLERSAPPLLPCPSCGAPAPRESDTLDCHFDVAWYYMAIAVPPRDRHAGLLDHGELARWLPVSRFVHGSDTGSFVLDDRAVAKALRDTGTIGALKDGEPYGPSLMHGMVRAGKRKMSKHLGNSVNPMALVRTSGADALRLAILLAAAPEKSFSWNPVSLAEATSLLGTLWTFAEPRLRARQQHDLDTRIDLATRQRRRLHRFDREAAAKVATFLEAMKPHLAIREVTAFLGNITAFESRVGTFDQMTRANREAVLWTLLRLLQLIAPMAPFIAEELWHRAGEDTFVGEKQWPAIEGLRSGSSRSSGSG